MQLRDRLVEMGLEDDGPYSARRRLRDYASAGKRLLAQRLVIYTAAFFLTAYFYDTRTAFLFYMLILLAEAFDTAVCVEILRSRALDPDVQRKFKAKLFLSTFFSASTIALFNLSLAGMQGDSTHFMPLFMLFSASIFAAMNNHQFLSVLSLRLAIYVATLLAIPIRDLVIAGPDVHPDLWLQFFTVLFVMAFILECSRNFIAVYMKNLRYIRALEREHENAKQAYQAKSEFVSTVSHELRTPLTSIKGSLQLIESGQLGPLPETMKQLFGVAVRNAERLGELINDILDLQKAEAGRMDYDFAEVDLVRLLDDTVERMTPFADRFGIEITRNLDTTDRMIRGDRKRLDQVFTNILSNAVKFSNENGRVWVNLDRHDGKLRISIRDEGIGIPAHARKKVFERFSQIDSTDKRHKGGTGLGMSISKLIVEAHGGAIGFESAEGGGTVFFVDLDPLAPEDAETRVDEAMPLPEKKCA